ncbi:hypothetical protein [Streptomyces sp. NBC_00620]|uniref:hypothetical protein n=1 Tax=Streptomyces sp. NBC_00620 TaxID=2903666 RepID=UPI0022526245|nr:hypothetical protein [Streptomyces sp. NBC_00620]MCX4974248.1 hypothetical protein [Streptomyces sp. NBC_00620]
MSDRPSYRLSSGQTEDLVRRLLLEMADHLETHRPDRILTATGRIALIQVTTMSPPLGTALRAKAPEIDGPISRSAYAAQLRETAGGHGGQSSRQPSTPEEVAELHGLADQDYDGAALQRESHRDDAHPVPYTTEAQPEPDEDTEGQR